MNRGFTKGKGVLDIYILATFIVEITLNRWEDKDNKRLMKMFDLFVPSCARQGMMEVLYGKFV